MFHQLVSHIWNSETIPQALLEGGVIHLHKKGDKLGCENYRGIALLNAAYKVFAKVLYNRQVPHAETVIEEQQCAFRRERSTTDQLFNLRSILHCGSEFKV